ncbi:GntP family permease [Mobilicoccus caccae]|uniref:Citrate transporter n=1 Tax=Mobilicoccus caccae TaxID=1859295 RepID=A0ABQ6IWJ1_9MICO|nr:GntP family permease [Mobilicoccus caccae]GMA41653.1 citrate transporter [Mobilicoccus caccae]
MDVLGLFGIVASLALLIFFAYRGINVMLLAPICALFATVLAGAPILATYTQVFMPALGKFAITYFPLFMLGAIFGKLMDDSGAARRIAESIVDKVGAHRAILAIVLSCAILTYGGVSLFVVAFAVFPIAAAMFREAGVPKRLIPAAIALGSFTFTMTALPGTPAIQNAIPSPYFGTDAFAAPGLGTIAGVIMFGGGLAWLMYRSKSAGKAGEGYEDGPLMNPVPKSGRKVRDTLAAGEAHPPSETHHGLEPGPDREPARGATAVVTEETKNPTMPTWLAYVPVFIVIVINWVMVNMVFPAMDTSYLADKKYGAVALADVRGIWGIIVALVVAIVFMLAAHLKRYGDTKKTLNEGTMGSLLPIFNTASEVGYGAVIAALPAFMIVRDGVLGISDNPLISTSVAVNVLAGITGSASGGMSIALQALGNDLAAQAQAMGIDMDLMHRITALSSGGMDALPHNGAVITLLAITGLTHRQSYKDIGMVAVIIPVLSIVAVIILGTMFGSF